jgi:hypothetical protein
MNDNKYKQNLPKSNNKLPDLTRKKTMAAPISNKENINIDEINVKDSQLLEILNNIIININHNITDDKKLNILYEYYTAFKNDKHPLHHYFNNNKIKDKDKDLFDKLYAIDKQISNLREIHKSVNIDNDIWYSFLKEISELQALYIILLFKSNDKEFIIQLQNLLNNKIKELHEINKKINPINNKYIKYKNKYILKKI